MIYLIKMTNLVVLWSIKFALCCLLSAEPKKKKKFRRERSKGAAAASAFTCTTQQGAVKSRDITRAQSSSSKKIQGGKSIASRVAVVAITAILANRDGRVLKHVSGFQQGY